MVWIILIVAALAGSSSTFKKLPESVRTSVHLVSVALYCIVSGPGYILGALGLYLSCHAVYTVSKRHFDYEEHIFSHRYAWIDKIVEKRFPTIFNSGWYDLAFQNILVIILFIGCILIVVK